MRVEQDDFGNFAAVSEKVAAPQPEQVTGERCLSFDAGSALPRLSDAEALVDHRARQLVSWNEPVRGGIDALPGGGGENAGSDPAEVVVGKHAGDVQFAVVILKIP